MRQLLKELRSKTGQHFKIQYFCWKNKIDSNRYRYSQMTEEEFRKTCPWVNREWEFLQKWEETLEYKNWYALYLQYRQKQDFLEIYDTVRKKALEGDEKAIKLFLQLQKELRKINKNNDVVIENEEETTANDDDDDLKLFIP